jgi:hypothetical protein
VDEFLLDTGQGEECLAEGEGEPGADLEDRPVVLDEPGERGAGLAYTGGTAPAGRCCSATAMRRAATSVSGRRSGSPASRMLQSMWSFV